MTPNQTEFEAVRRRITLGLGALIGASATSQLLGGSGLSSALAFQQSDKTSRDLFSPQHKAIILHISDTILPKTDTPSASELGVHHFIEHQLLHVYDSAQQNRSMALCDHIEEAAKQQFNASFVVLTAAQQTALLNKVESVAPPFTKETKAEFSLIKSLVVFGFFTTEIGATQILKYQAVPGGFTPSIPYATVGSAWGSLGFY